MKKQTIDYKDSDKPWNTKRSYTREYHDPIHPQIRDYWNPEDPSLIKIGDQLLLNQVKQKDVVHAAEMLLYQYELDYDRFRDFETELRKTHDFDMQGNFIKGYDPMKEWARIIHGKQYESATP